MPRMPGPLALLLLTTCSSVACGAGATESPRRLLAAAPRPAPAVSATPHPVAYDDAHQPLRLTAGTAVALVLAPLVSALSNAAGVGGGAVFVPLYCSLLSIGLKEATVLSQASITGGAIGSVAFSITRRHPAHPDALLTDFDLALALLPPLLVGVAAGVLINIALPSWILTFLLIPLLILFAVRTARTGLRMRGAEQQAQQRRATAAACGSPWAAPLQQPCPQSEPKRALQLARHNVSAPACGGRGKEGAATASAGSACASTTGSSAAGTMGAATPRWQIAAAGVAQPAAAWQQQERSGCCAGVGAGAGRGSSEHGLEKGAEEEVQMAGQGSGLLRWLDSPTLLDGVLECGPLHEPQPLGNLPDACGSQGWEEALQRQCGLGCGPQPAGLGCAGRREELGMAPAAGGAGPRFPWLKLGEMVLLWLVFLGLQLGKDHFGRCTWPYGALFGLQAALALVLSLLFCWQAVGGQRRVGGAGEAQPILAGAGPGSSPVCPPGAQPAGPEKPPGWTPRQLAVAWTVSLVGGALAGVLGLGGGMVMAPLMLELGVHPAAAAATSGLMVLCSSSTAVAAFATAGRLAVAHAAVFGTACMVAALAGTALIGRAVRRSGHASHIVLLLAAIIGLGALATTAFSGQRAVLDLVHGTNLGPPPFCG